MNKGIEVGDIVCSKINTVYRGTYKVVKTNKTTCWVVLNEDKSKKMVGGKYAEVPHHIYKNNRYSIVEKV